MRSRLAVVVVLLSCVALAGQWASATVRLQDPKPAPAAQEPKPAATDATPPSARPEDVKSMDAILAALYDVISGPAGQKRDWDRFRSLFVPGARLIPTAVANGASSVRVLTPEGYIERAGPSLERGFFEREVARKVDAFGEIAHVFSTYESRRAAGDATPFARGINSIQLLKDGNRWWIVSIYWEGERADNPIPAAYLPKNR